MIGLILGNNGLTACNIVYWHTGIGLDDAHSLVKAAETCCEEDIYHFDDTERFFLVSCLALW